MKKLTLGFLFIFGLIIKINSQTQIYQLHPILGNTLEYTEIKKYYLFDNLKIDSADYQIIKNDSLFFLVKIPNEFNSEKIFLTNSQILLEKEKVEKINNYIHFLNEKDSVKTKIIIDKKVPTTDSLNIKLDTKNPQFIKSVKKDIKRKFWEESRNQYYKEQKNGLYGHSTGNHP